MYMSSASSLKFLSTPSGWRATVGVPPVHARGVISIHALRVEGDLLDYVYILTQVEHFYPRPPGGGRLGGVIHGHCTTKFLSTPSGWRATPFKLFCYNREYDFYPRPPGGGRPYSGFTCICIIVFLSTPSGWRATAKTDKIFVCFCEKGRRICLFKTRKEKNLPVAF